MKPDPLRGPKLKLERANRHIRDTESAVRDFILRNPYRMFSEVNNETGEKLIKVALPREPIPGEAECAAAFGNDLQDFESTGTQRKVSRLSSAAKDLIAAQKPYRGGNDLLWSLHALDLMDKHRQLVPVQSTGSGIAFFGTANKPMRLIANPRWSPIENDMTVAIMPRDSQPQGNFKISFNIAFGDVEPVKGKQVVAVLNDLAGLVEGILLTFETRFF